MKSNILLAGLSLVLALVSGCAAPPTGTAPDDGIIIAPGVTMHLPKAPTPWGTTEVVQTVVASFGGTTVSFEGRIAATPERFTMVCTDPLGRRAVSIVWTADGVTYDVAPWVPAALRAQNMLADLAVMYWPQDALAQALPGATVETGPAARTVSVGGKPALQIEYAPAADGDIWSGNTRYRNKAWNYSLTIESAKLAP